LATVLLKRCLAPPVSTSPPDEDEVLVPFNVEGVADPESFDEAAGLEVSALVPELLADELDEFEEPVWATATPQPMNAAAPTPSATASPPIRPTYIEAPIAFSQVDQSLSGG
jgi:hypothetical protein